MLSLRTRSPSHIHLASIDSSQVIDANNFVAQIIRNVDGSIGHDDGGVVM